jgi:hypothetical protein
MWHNHLVDPEPLRWLIRRPSTQEPSVDEVLSKLQRYSLATISCGVAQAVAWPIDAPASCLLLAVTEGSLLGLGPVLLPVGLSALAFGYRHHGRRVVRSLRFDADTGVGLPLQQPDHIFNTFFTTKSHGTGMGLQISRFIVESHGGCLWAGDNSPCGARFAFTLPVKIEGHV